MVALLILGSATLLYSCGKKGKTTSYDLETLMTESSEDRTITMVEGGYRSYTFFAPLVEGYSMRKEPYQEFRRGIKMTTYSADTLSLVNAVITANYAIYYEKQSLWEVKGDVVIHKFNREEGDTIVKDITEVYTQQLFWNATTKKIYSNVDTKVLQGGGWHFGVGFDADEDLKNIHFRKYSSEVEFEMSQTKKSADTLATDADKTPAANRGESRNNDNGILRAADAKAINSSRVESNATKIYTPNDVSKGIISPDDDRKGITSMRPSTIKENPLQESDSKRPTIEGATLKEAGIKEAGIKEMGIKEAVIKEMGIKEMGIKEAGIKEMGVKEDMRKVQ